MKALLTTIIFLSSLSAFSQNWCDAGANWKYNFFSVFYAEGYTEIKYVGDTVINGQAAKKLNKHHYFYSFFNSQYEDYDIGMEYTYENNGVAYLWYENAWDTLYNFNATVGESWRMAKQPFNGVCDSNSILTVTAIGTKVINAVTLNYLVVDFNFPVEYSDTIVEKIGFIGSYMFPYDGCDGALDVNEGGAFRCYQDNGFAAYKPYYSQSCDFIYSVGIEENTTNNSIKIVPNPAAEQISIIGILKPDTEFIISDSFGKNWSFDKIDNNIDIANLPSGVYILTILDGSGVNQHKFIVK